LQRLLLEDEGVAFDNQGRIDLSRFGWSGPAPGPEL
jgi:alkylated DNA nucleotide flippase Atl1